MSRGNLHATRIKPATPDLLTLHVLRRERLSPHFVRVTLGGGDIARFEPMGFDQWFRLFLPVSDDSLSRAPRRFTTAAYLRYLTVAKANRPILRNYSVRAYRPDGPELDVDFVVHDPAGPAATWAQTCTEGDPVAILDEGIGFNPPPLVRQFLFATEESGLPALAGILSSLPHDARGQAFIEIPGPEDRQPLTAPAGIDITWLVRDPATDTPGRAALAAATAAPLPDGPCYGWVVGESTLPVTLRRHWLANGIPPNHIMFCGYWKARRAN
ncbi:siderophore-interacting protein [Actinophytocola sp.]|uniref:siderophore-interacting protein n=1 Tax=Actinophytocola sp. TaxID=1872138 RepID=UPI002D7F237E|nr:siderophore-interacting protein [Actinophytocola sp.]HET9141410.1 siderophore-interacting protein [Actinophytocola sp.]